VERRESGGDVLLHGGGADLGVERASAALHVGHLPQTGDDASDLETWRDYGSFDHDEVYRGRRDQSAWNRWPRGASTRSKVWAPKWSRCAWSRLAGSRAER